MIEALDAFGRARKNISGLTWAAMMGGVDKKYRPIMHKSEGVGQIINQIFPVICSAFDNLKQECIIYMN